MVKTLRIYTFGSLRFAWVLEDESEVPFGKFLTRKSEALLLYLAYTQRSHSRENLASLLWSESTTDVSLRNLRNVLSDLRKLAGDYLIFDRDQVEFDTTQPYATDFGSLQKILIKEVGSVEVFEAALAHYTGEFLANFHIRKARLFEDWIQVERENWEVAYLEGLLQLATSYLYLQKYNSGIKLVSNVLEKRPWHEGAYRLQMMLLAKSGNHAAALSTYDRCVVALKDELGIEPAKETQSLYRQLTAQERQINHNLPQSIGVFFGRESEFSESVQRLKLDSCRLLTIMGAGGIGKTRLALEVASYFADTDRSSSAFHDGVFWISLAQIESNTFTANDLADAVRFAIAKAIGYTYQQNSPTKGQLSRYLSDKHVLLVLDNFEHLIDLVPRISCLLQEAPQLKILSTSRERLNLDEEWVMPLEGFKTESILDSKDELAPAIQFFISQAQQGLGDVNLCQDAEEIKRICKLVNGLPLGIKLAAGWLRMLPVNEIASQSEKSLDFLTTRLRNIPVRHRSLRAVFNSTWDLLGERERQILRYLSVFCGSFTLEDANAIIQVSISELLQFIDKSLIQHEANGRYTVSSHLRQYIAEKNSSSDQFEINELHCRYFSQLFSELDLLRDGKIYKNASNLFLHYVSDLYVAWRHVVNNHKFDAMKKMGEQLILYWRWHGIVEEGLLFVQYGLDMISADDHPTVRGWLLYSNACLLMNQAHYEEAEKILIDARKLLALSDDQRTFHRSLIVHCQVKFTIGEFDDAREILQDAFRLAFASKEPRQLASTYRHCGALEYHESLTFELTDFEKFKQKLSLSLGELQKGLSIAQDHHLIDEEGLLNHLASSVFQKQEEYKKAYDTGFKALECFEILQIPVFMIDICFQLVILEINLDRLDSAKEYFYQALAIAEDKRDIIGRLIALFCSAEIYRAQRQYELEALSLLHIVSNPNSWLLIKDASKNELKLLDEKLPQERLAEIALNAKRISIDQLLDQVKRDFQFGLSCEASN